MVHLKAASFRKFPQISLDEIQCCTHVKTHVLSSLPYVVTGDLHIYPQDYLLSTT